MYDMHVHTDVTDGRLSPTDVIDCAANTGLDGIIFTDHSVVTWSSSLSEYASNRGVSLLTQGMEVSTLFKGRRLHILLYGSSLLKTEVMEYLAAPLQAKNDWLESVCDRLRRQGYLIPSAEDILRREPGSELNLERRMLSRTQIARTLAKVTGLTAFEARQIVEHAAASVPPVPSTEAYLPTEDVLSIAESNRIVPVIAHPLWFCADEKDIEAAIRDLSDACFQPVRGVEPTSYHHRKFDAHSGLLELAHTRRWTLVGGSDFHGNGKVDLGEEWTDAGALKSLGVIQ